MKNRDINTLLDIMRQLRDPVKGCPWDQKQTFETVVPYTIEEAYEVAEAIEEQDFEELQAELGDLLFQVVFYAQMAKEQDLFDFNDVVQGIVEKMTRRHPHVFGDADYADEAELGEAWEQHKKAEQREKQKQHKASALDGVAKALPALVRSDKLQRKAKRVGFDWPDASGALDKCREEIRELEQAMEKGDHGMAEEEAGDLLFAASNVARLLGLDSEQTLRRSNDKFVRRFRAMERHLHQQGQPDLAELDLETLESAWQAVKDRENG